ncbi:uncharacterized protein FOMMEDRAFT_114694 [Fomitiporia mediterranea MF3/22]|uniref:uncharacterized protein n=1 Tax=Fomitiporia mediterranea (strain MF3/22) TaxID=694068 RepID=UPI000440851A|nr:uncharacterized protein FOMMEDRAFT_114694 [Fomitiporia mediterranea MF3/22]EJC97919.1 hypothetical protein FOMMEDRAFT_114694 [Fomitiporia mediterranea MF3/22]
MNVRSPTQPSSASTPYAQTQPRLSRFTLRGFLSLPRRLCSPPAAVGKVRSFGLTPIFDVKLEDVLDRKHLPPLSLKDFEEWLLYVEQSVENLYFVLWLREYTTKYDRWIAKVRTREAKARRVVNGGAQAHSTYRVAWSTTTPTSPSLALYFARARETFLVPGAPYELTLPPALLDALSVVHGHPDPAVFAPARAHVEGALRASLRNCVRAAYSNVGTYRAACGIAAGIFFLLVGTVPALAVNFAKSQTRWERLVILPGLWLGLTILIASLRGICMMIYIFGDFRQLRKFELVRPPPPTTNREIESCDDELTRSPTIVAPTRPVRALTAPPKVAVRIPSQTPTLSYGATTVSLTTDITFPGTSTGTESSYTNTTSQTHAHTISISSQKSRGGASSLYAFGNGYTCGNADTDTRSVPPYATDDESVDAEMDDDDDADAMSSASDHGIYISPAMPSPEPEDDPAVVNAAMALIAGSTVNGSGTLTLPQSSATSPVLSGPSASTAMSGTATGTPVPALAKNQTTQTAPQLPTASFIPPYPYSDADSITKRGHSRSRTCSGGVGNSTPRDLEAAVSSTPVASAVQRSCAFDFDALPLVTPPISVPHSRPRGPDTHIDVNVTANGVNDEKGLQLPSPSGYGLATDCDPTSPIHLEDVAGLCEKEDGSRSNSSRSKWRSSHSRFRLPSFRSLSATFHSMRPSSALSQSYSDFTSLGGKESEKLRDWHSRCAIESRVPAFGPVTRVLAPEVARAQWEIVVRAAVLATLLCVVVCGVVVSLPVPGKI